MDKNFVNSHIRMANFDFLSDITALARYEKTDLKTGYLKNMEIPDAIESLDASNDCTESDFKIAEELYMNALAIKDVVLSSTEEEDLNFKHFFLGIESSFKNFIFYKNGMELEYYYLLIIESELVKLRSSGVAGFSRRSRVSSYSFTQCEELSSMFAKKHSGADFSQNEFITLAKELYNNLLKAEKDGEITLEKSAIAKLENAFYELEIIEILNKN